MDVITGVVIIVLLTVGIYLIAMPSSMISSNDIALKIEGTLLAELLVPAGVAILGIIGTVLWKRRN